MVLCGCCAPQEEQAYEDVGPSKNDGDYKQSYSGKWSKNVTPGSEDPEKDYAYSEASSSRSRYKSTDLEEKPRQIVEDGAFYTGQWRGTRRCGEGKIERRGIGTYEGQFVDDKATGRGQFKKLNGDVYEGQWLGDLAHGKGTYMHADGSSYEGQWREDLKSGFGCETWLDGSTFEGGYVRGKKHGRGIYHSADRSTFEGEFFMDMMDGEGQYLFADGRVYHGQWRQSRMSGKGRMVWPDGRHFEGEYEDDRRQGMGKFTWPDGRSYHGQWLNGKQHGRGTYTSPEHRTWTGEWRGGQKVKPGQATREAGYGDSASSEPRGNKNRLDFGASVREQPLHSGESDGSSMSDRTASTNMSMSRSGPAVPPSSRVAAAHLYGGSDGLGKNSFTPAARSDGGPLLKRGGR